MKSSSIQSGARIVCQFSCGAASAVATKLAIAQFGATHEVVIINAFLQDEHEDNARFLADCEAWFGRPVCSLGELKHKANAGNVFLQRGYMKGPHGAPCSGILKRHLLASLNRAGDVMVLGFTADGPDATRFWDFEIENPDRPAIAPLIERGLFKTDCQAMLQRAGIELPFMYRKGYRNNNCIGCVKGGEGYWRAIREDFPEAFERRCRQQDAIGPGSYFLRFRSGPRKDERMSLRELPPGKADRNEELPACSFFCEIAERDIEAAA